MMVAIGYTGAKGIDALHVFTVVSVTGQRLSYSPHSDFGGPLGTPWFPLCPSLALHTLQGDARSPLGAHAPRRGTGRSAGRVRHRRTGAAPPEQGLKIRAAAQLRACSAKPRLTTGRAQVLERDTSASRAQACALTAPGCPTERRRLEVGRPARRTVRLRSSRSTQLYNRCSSQFDATCSGGVPPTEEGGISPR
ncbi:hypothetical protein NDU88_004124 [Pleurodeles waltl]|uniref:Uncharacterized protein n=1 Tax=Pleurodeles waltl TaxID=8319 RepID=A0AAV7T8U4_PLEWA|nr:hypothetical protein NDU88_004124 [Pleurodeles waltl]